MLIECNDPTALGQHSFDPSALLCHHSLRVFAGRALDGFDLFKQEPALGWHALGIFLKPCFYPSRHFVTNSCNNQLHGGGCQPLVADRRGAAFLAAVLAGGREADFVEGLLAGFVADFAAGLVAVFFTAFAGALLAVLLAVLLLRAAGAGDTFPAELVAVFGAVFGAVFADFLTAVFAAGFKSTAADLGSVGFLVLGLRASVPRFASARRISLSPHNSSRR